MEERSRRVFGGGHPQTLQNVGDLGILLFDMGDDAAAAPLLREAVQGLMDVYSAEHPLVRHFQSFLDDLTESGSEEESGSDAEEEQEQEQEQEDEEEEAMYWFTGTVGQRMAKRRRRE